MPDKCPVCEKQHLVEDDQQPVGRRELKCLLCGKYSVDSLVWGALLPAASFDEHRWLMSCILRQKSEENRPLFLESLNFIDELLENADRPKGVSDQADRLLCYFCTRNEALGIENLVPYDPDTDYPIAFAKNPAQFNKLMFHLAHKDLIRANQRKTAAEPRIKGWERFEELKAQGASSNQAFVAMSFEDDLDPVWKDGIIPALEHFKLDVKFIKNEEHDEKIDQLIIEEIKKSRLIVADFTLHRSSVYFEAGFAEGLGIRVIRTCKSSDLEDLAFDTKTYNHILWDDPAELKEKLVKRLTKKPL